MNRKHGWLILLVVVVMLVVACGPEMATSTPITEPEDEGAPTEVAAAETPREEPQEAEVEEPTQEPEAGSGEAPEEGQVQVSDDWRVLGSPDAKVTIVEYSDFQ